MKYYAFCYKINDQNIKISLINNIYPAKIITYSNTFKSSLYKIGIVYQENKTIFIGKSHFKSSIINDVKKMRYYIFGKYESYEDIEKKLIRSDLEMM